MSRPIHSLHIIGSRRLAGAERFFVRLVGALAERGHPTVAVIRGDSPVAAALSPAVQQVHLGMRSKYDLWSAWQIRRLIARRQPDIVQTYMGRASRLTRLPAGSRSVHIARLGGFYGLDGYYRHADAWVGNTHGIVEYLLRGGLPAERVHYIGNFVPPTRAVDAAEVAALRQRLGLPPQARVVLAMGRLVEKKGFDDLLDAWARLPASDADGRPLHLVLAGSGGHQQALADRVAALKLGARAHLVGWQNDLALWYALGEIFVCPSRQEPLGNVILEAWRHRIPLLSTRNEGACELVRDGENGRLVPLRDPAALAEGILALLQTPAEARRALIDAGQRCVDEEHSEQRVTEAYLALYERATRRPR
ncbi:MAG: glycosyltransferase [Burkholderiaceae bacterium]|nr:glycosyltransferase [Burkholderiaceae bacterium]